MNKHIEHLKSIAEAMGMTFLFEAYPRLNLLLDKVKRVKGEVNAPFGNYPVCICLLPVGGEWNIHPTLGDRRDRQNCIVAFAEPMPLDYTGVQAGEISERLKELATEFIDRLNDSGKYEGLYGKVSYKIGYDQYDACLCLVTIEFTLSPLIGECVKTSF